MTNRLLELWKGSRTPFTGWRSRDELVRRFAWGIPNEEALAAIAELGRPIVEIGAGTGYWASLLRARGVDVVAYDVEPPDIASAANSWHANAERHTEVLRGGPEKVNEHPDRVLFLCWPPYDEPMATECLERYRGDLLIFVGEGWGGCTTDDRFFELLEAGWEDHRSVNIPTWWGIHDWLRILRRKEGN